MTQGLDIIKIKLVFGVLLSYTYNYNVSFKHIMNLYNKIISLEIKHSILHVLLVFINVLIVLIV